MDNLDILKIASKKLKSSREKLNISTKDVADDLRLDQKIIDDIDNGNFKNFKNYVFLKGYLKNYANFLGVHLELPEINKKIKKNKKRDPKKSLKTDKKDIRAFIFSILGISFLALGLVSPYFLIFSFSFSLVGFITGIKSFNKNKREKTKISGLSVFSIVSGVFCLLLLLAIIIIFSHLFAFENSLNISINL